MAMFSSLDLIAGGAFVAAWIGYHVVVEWSPLGRRSLNSLVDAYRVRWMRQMLGREMRIVDTQIMASLQNGTAFFASTSLFAIGGALALLQATDQVLDVFRSLPFAVESSRAAWETKVLGLAVMFVYAFFKFSWAYRLFNYAAIVMGATPTAEHKDDPDAIAAADRAARMTAVAGRHFNRGQRAFFFALAYLGWFVNAWVFLAATAGVLFVLLRRQFGSDSRAVLANAGVDR